MICSDCRKNLPEFAKRCPCGWIKNKSGNQSNFSMIPPAGTVPVCIGDRVTWMPSCIWETDGRRCKMVATTNGAYCAWHGGANTPYMSDNYQEFVGWIENDRRWNGNSIQLFKKIMGVGRWMEPDEWAKEKKSGGKERFVGD